MNNRPRVLFVATVDSHLYYFHLPFMRLLTEMGYEVECAAGPSGFAGRIESAGFRVIPIAFTKNPLDVHLPAITAQLVRLMRERHYVLVHTHTPVAGFIGRYAARRAGIPNIIYTAHGFHFHGLGNQAGNRVYAAVEKLASHWTDVLVVINHDDAVAARALFSRPGLEIEEIPGVGVDTGLFVPADPGTRRRERERLGIKDAGPVIGWVGEFTRRKRPGDVLNIARQLLAAIPDVRFVMAGEGPLADGFKLDLQSGGLGATVLLPGWQEDIPSLLHACDGILSTASQEGLPRNILEAMACGLPAVTWDIRGCRDLVLDGKTGFLLPFGDVHGMCLRLEQLVRDESLARSMGAAGRDRIVQGFSQELVLRAMRTMYENRLGGGTSCVSS